MTVGRLAEASAAAQEEHRVAQEEASLVGAIVGVAVAGRGSGGGNRNPTRLFHKRIHLRCVTMTTARRRSSPHTLGRCKPWSCCTRE